MVNINIIKTKKGGGKYKNKNIKKICNKLYIQTEIYDKYY